MRIEESNGEGVEKSSGETHRILSSHDKKNIGIDLKIEELPVSYSRSLPVETPMPWRCTILNIRTRNA